MQKLDRLSKVGIVAIIVIALVGGAGVWWWSKQPLESAKADPPVTTPAPAPVCDPGTDPCTPEVATEQAELKRLRAEAEAAYRGALDERIRLTREGGADEPTPELVRYASGPYLEKSMKLLRAQKASGETVSGPSSLTVTPRPGEARSGSDSRLTMAMCEDNSRASYTVDGVTRDSPSWRGTIFAAVIDGQVKVVDAGMSEVESCQPA